MSNTTTTTTTEPTYMTVKIGRGASIHLRRGGSRFPVCGQANLRSGISNAYNALPTCKRCIKLMEKRAARMAANA